MIQQQIKIERLAANPLIAPGDVQPSFPDWEVLGVFNAGVAQYGDEVILLLRVAERPRQTDPGRVLVPVLNAERSGDDAEEPIMNIVAVDKENSGLDFPIPG